MLERLLGMDLRVRDPIYREEAFAEHGVHERVAAKHPS